MIEFEASSERKTFERTNFLNMDFGAHQVRLVGEPKAIFVHYFQRASIQCLGRDCPLCANNKRIEMEHPENPQSVRGYNKPSKRHYINILDRTAVKVCPSCGTENKKTLTGMYNTNCKQCSGFIIDTPETLSNKVKVANLSETVKEQLLSYQNTILDADKNKVGLENFDVVFLVTQAGGKKNIAALPSQPLNTEPIDDVSEFLYDLEKVVIKLEPDEIISLMNGVELKDIFASRRGAKALAEDVEDEEVSDTVKTKLEDLFKE